MTLIRATTVIEASEICEEEELHRLARPFAPDTRLGTPAQMMTYAHWDYYPQTPNCRNPLARADTDVLALDDDVGMPGTMMLSPATRRTFFKSRLGEIIQAARAIKPDLHILFHSDGYFEPIIGDLIEIGVNAINPLQPDHMDAIRIRQRFGPRLAFWGTVGRQTTFSFATPDDIRQEVQYRIETLGCAGLILCSAYDIDEPDIPWENIAAFLEAVEAYG